MGFEGGVLSCTMYDVPGGLPGDARARFREHAAPPIAQLGRTPIEGWVTSRHLLDNAIDETNWRVAGRPFLYLMKAERKIPAALLRAECRMEELALLRAENRAFLKRHERIEIRKQIVDRLLPTMPPTLTGMSIVVNDRDHAAYATAVSARQIDMLTNRFERTMDRPLIPCTPLTAAARRRQVDLRDLRPTCFVPGFEGAGEPGTVGDDFLTWLWFVAETRQTANGFDLGDEGAVAVAIDGPLCFEFRGEGAHETRLRKGAPALAYEARAALMAGKKLTQARLTLARGDRQWATMIDGAGFVLRGMALPKGEADDPVGRFEDRLMALHDFRGMLLALFDRFVDERIDGPRWEGTCRDVMTWIEARDARR